jgi:hypothetical protein
VRPTVGPDNGGTHYIVIARTVVACGIVVACAAARRIKRELVITVGQADILQLGGTVVERAACFNSAV